MDDVNNSAILVSVVMPSFNQAVFIERSIRSILDHTDVKLELIVMDGGSTDGTQAILSRLGKEAGVRLRWYSEIDRGPAHAVNKALALAKGDIIGWLNADDIYFSGAIERAIKSLEDNPEWLMVYGHAQHIDECGQIINDYPTKQPDASLPEFANGCYICQPTVFLRKEFVKVFGTLDEKLKTAFDLEWWLRIFSQRPEAIGFVDEFQAGSRLHASCITLNQREEVIREGMQVLAKYLGACPIHWFHTYVEDVLKHYPHGQQIKNIKVHLKKFARSISGCLTWKDRKRLRRFFKVDERYRLAEPDVYLEVTPNGFLPAHSVLRVRARRRWQRIVICGQYKPRNDRPTQISISTPEAQTLMFSFEHEGAFKLDIPLPHAVNIPAYWTFNIESTTMNDIDMVCQIKKIRLLKN